MAEATVSGRESSVPGLLYSFRRCPYAIRARLALAAGGLHPGVDLELREVSLRAKPPELLAIAAAGTVPVLEWRGATGALEGEVLGESLAIMLWALARHDPQGWLTGWSDGERSQIDALIVENDGPFKHHLDRFKYAARHGPAGLAAREEHRDQALAILRRWSAQLGPGGWLLGARPSLADMALLPFVRQFRLADPEGFDAAGDLAPLQNWLHRFLNSEELQAVMALPWAPRQPWRSPSWLYHLALSEEWQAARTAGSYRRSTRGLSLEHVGFVHASYGHQLEGTYRRFYADLPGGAVQLLTIDPQRLAAAGVPVRPEPAPESGELFPHLYGALPLEAVLRVEKFPA